MDKRNKIIGQSKEMPYDFWNYRVNPILGYYVKPEVISRKCKTK